MIALDILMSIYQGSIFIYTLRKQFYQKPHSFLYEIVTISLIALFFAAIQYLELPVPDTLFLIIPLIYTLLTTKERFFTSVLWVLLDGFLFFGTLTLVSSLFDIQIGINGDVIYASEETMLIYGFAGNAAVTVVLNISAKINKVKSIIARKEMLLFFFMLLLCFFINECFFSARLPETDWPVLLIGSICSFVLMIMIMILYERITKSTKQQRQAEMTAQTALLVVKQQNELKSIYTNMLAQQHDLRNRIVAAEKILSSKELNADQREHVLNLLQHDASPQFFITGNIAVDAILTAKSILMENAGITFDFVEYPIPILPVPEGDFCMLIGNALDNAIEGVARLPKDAPSRQIRLAFSKVWNMLFITCVNDADTKSIRQHGDTFLSSKENPELHGFGIENMKKIVATAGGTIEFEVGHDRFTVQIMLGESQNAGKNST